MLLGGTKENECSIFLLLALCLGREKTFFIGFQTWFYALIEWKNRLDNTYSWWNTESENNRQRYQGNSYSKVHTNTYMGGIGFHNLYKVPTNNKSNIDVVIPRILHKEDPSFWKGAKKIIGIWDIGKLEKNIWLVKNGIT